MFDLSQNGLSHNQVVDLLQRGSVDKREFKVEIIRQNAHLKWLEYTEFSINCDAETSVKYAGKARIKQDNEIDWRKDYMRLVMFYPSPYGELEFSFVPLRAVTQSDNIEDGVTISEIELYDETIMLKDNSLINTITFEAGTPYISVISKLITEVGITNLFIEPTEKVLNTDRTFEMGEERLEIVNQLLQEINYTQLEVNLLGALTSKPYIEPSKRPIEISYIANENSIIVPQKNIVRDQFKKYNLFVGYYTNPESKETWRYEFSNNSAADPTSIPNLGYIVASAPQNFENVPDEETLGDLVRRWAAETSESYETATLTTAIMPHHGVNDTISISSYGLNNRWVESGWSIDAVGGDMTHELRSVSFL